MANHFFQFKQFTVYQHDDVLKVSTDSCLFGAMVAGYLSDKNIGHALDIGAGTGLLMLMLAQKNSAIIDGVEIQEASFKQATSNIGASPWRDRMQVFHADINSFEPTHQYNFILSNPPFFEEDLLSPSASNNIAKHDAGLKIETLCNQVNRLLHEDGEAAVLLPFHRKQKAIDHAAAAGLFPFKSISVRQTTRHSFFRTILFFRKMESLKCEEQEITIRAEDGAYSTDFTLLLKDYYLHL